MSEVPLLNIRLVVEQEDHTITEFLLIRTERTNEVAEALRQHGDGAVYKVDARGTVKALLVDDRALLHIVADICDMHAYLPQPALHLTDTQGIIEILGILGVDGAGEHVAEVLTPGYLLRGDGSIDLLGSLLHVLRILIRQVVLCEDGVHLSIVLPCLAKNINNGSDDVLMLVVGPLDDLHHRLVVSLSALQLTLGDNDVVDEGRVLRNEEGPVFVDTQLSYDLIVGTLDDLDDHRLLDMLVATGHVRHFHTVAIHGRHRVALCHEDGGAAIVGQERVAP